MKKMLSRIKYLFIAIEFSISLLFLILFMYLFKKHNRKIRKVWCSIQLKMLGITLHQKGIVDNSVNMYILNHQSLLDIIVLEAISDTNLCWVAKKEIGQLPIFGHILKAPEMIAIDRDSKKSLIQLLIDIKEKVAQNRPICIFPEGTRGRGDKLLKFKTGAKLAVEKLGLKVQPIVLTHTRDILDSKSFLANSGIVGVVYLDVIDTSIDGWFDILHTNMQKVLDDELANNTSNR